MQSHWNFCKENYPHADVADPGLDHSVAHSTLRISIFYAYQSVEHNELSDEFGRLCEQLPPMVKPATEIIKYISASNWSVCNAVWKSHLQTCCNVEGRVETRPLRMIDNMCMNLDSLTSILKGGSRYDELVNFRCGHVCIFTKASAGRRRNVVTQGYHVLDRRESRGFRTNVLERKCHFDVRR